MGRELKRKQAKREGKNVREVQKINRDKPMKPSTFIAIIVGLILCFVILYILTGVFVTKEIKWFEKDEDTTDDISTITNKILAVESLRQVEEEYYVYFYNPEEEDVVVSSKVSDLSKVYRVDLSDDFNSNYIGEVSSGIVDDISDLRVIDPTVIKVVSGAITEIYSGREEISSIE